MFGYGLVLVVLVLYLTALAWSAAEIGLLLALTLLGDAGVSLWLPTHADRIGRRRVLIACLDALRDRGQPEDRLRRPAIPRVQCPSGTGGAMIATSRRPG